MDMAARNDGATMVSSMLYLQEMMDDLSPIEQRVAGFFLQHTDTLVSTPILEVAEACETSKSSVVRLCKRMGYNGYKDFLTALSAELAVQSHRGQTEFSDIFPDSSVQSICTIVTQHSVQALENTTRLMDMQAMERAVQAVAQARRIDLYGAGNSGIIAQDAELKLRRIGFNATCAIDGHRQAIWAATLQPGDVAMLFSYYGETTDVLEAMAIAKAHGATTIAITRLGRNSLSLGADIVLNVASTEQLSRSGAMTSRLVMLGVVDMLFTCVSSYGYESLRGVLEQTASAISTKRRG